MLSSSTAATINMDGQFSGSSSPDGSLSSKPKKS